MNLYSALLCPVSKALRHGPYGPMSNSKDELDTCSSRKGCRNINLKKLS